MRFIQTLRDETTIETTSLIDEKFLSECCLEAGFDDEALILASKQEPAKGKLKENTEEAVRMGCSEVRRSWCSRLKNAVRPDPF